MTALLLCALLGLPADTPPADEGDLVRALPFVAAAVGEDMWAAFRGPEHRGHYRVVGSAFSRDANGLDLVVYWQVRSPSEDTQRTLPAADPRVREGTAPSVVNGTTEPVSPGTLGPGEVSVVMRSRYALPASAHPENLWWDVGGDSEVVRVHLRPHLSTPKKALVPPPPPWHAQRADANSDAAPRFSVLRATEDGRGCDWFLREGPDKPLRRLGTSKQACNLTYVALRPDGKKALVDAMAPEEIDLPGGAHKRVPLPEMPDGKAFAGYSERGDLAAMVAKTTLANNVIADPVWFTRFNHRNGKWTQDGTLAVHYPICDTFMARRTPMARDITCQYLHVPPAYTAPCQPLSMPRDACNNPTWEPPSDALLAQLDPHPPKPGPRAWAHQKRWTVLHTPWAEVAATVQIQASTTPALELPVMLVKNGKPVPLSDFSGTGPVYLAIRGPYLLLGRSDIPHQGPHHFLGAQGPDRVFRLYDLRSGNLLDSLAPGFNSVAFWPVHL